MSTETFLSPEHEAELNSSRITSELIEGRGYRTVGPEWRGRLAEMGCPAWAIRSEDAFPGLIIPMYEPRTGAYAGYQFKPAVPQLKPGKDRPLKYASPKGMGNRLDVHPQCTDLVADVSRPLWITEGVKKGDALASRGYATVTLTGVWNWRQEAGTLAEWENVPIGGRTVIVCFDSDAATKPEVRHAMSRLVGWLRRKAGTVYYLIVPDKVGEVQVKGVDDYFAAGGSPDALRAAATERAPEAPGARDATFSDAFLTDTVCEEALRGRYLFARGLGWMRYDGSRWTETDDRVVVEEIRQWAKTHFEDVVEEYKRDQSRDVKARMEGWRQILTSGRLRALASLSSGPLHTEATEFDAHPDLLNCPNGVVDLRTGELLDPDPDYRFTKVTGADYDPGADDEDFRAALRALPEDVVDWYQVRVGQAMTGYMTSDDVMMVQVGGGENGKSTLAVPLKRAAGSYYVLVSHRVILGSADQHPTEKMDLKGARYALMEETPEARQLNVHQLKEVVGTPDVTARRIRQDPVTFSASHSLFVNTNFLPAVAETDHATWRRLALVTFPYTFRKRQEDVRGSDDRLGDPGLRERCATRQEPAQAALAWAVAGAVRWYRDGRQFPEFPERVAQDTQDWRRKGDLVLMFLEERCQFGDGLVVTTADLFQSFGQWLSTAGHRPWTQRLFTDRLMGHELMAGNGAKHVRRKINGAVKRQWEGIRLIPNDEGVTTPSGMNPFAGVTGS